MKFKVCINPCIAIQKQYLGSCVAGIFTSCQYLSLLFCVFIYIHLNKTKPHLKRVSAWDHIYHCELTENTTYRN